MGEKPLVLAVAVWMEQVLLGTVGHGLHAAVRASPGSHFIPMLGSTSQLCYPPGDEPIAFSAAFPSTCRLSFDSLARPLLALPWEIPVADASSVMRLMVQLLGKGEYLQGVAWGAPGGVKENAAAAASSLAM